MANHGFTIPLVLGTVFVVLMTTAVVTAFGLPKSTPSNTETTKLSLPGPTEPIIVEAKREEAPVAKNDQTQTVVLPPSVEIKPEPAPVVPKPNVATAKVSITIFDIDGWKSITSDDFHFNVFSNSPKVRFETKGVTTWQVDNLSPGRYSAEVYFPTASWQARTYSCENCTNQSFTSGTNHSSYDFDLLDGSHPHLKFGYARGSGSGLSQDNNSGTNNQRDTTPPITNIYYPQNGGTITYKLDGKVCAIQTAPTDDSGHNNVEISFQFDSGSWSEWKANQGYLCAETLPNGPHTMQYHSRDKAGNVEATRTLSFSVNIPGN